MVIAIISDIHDNLINLRQCLSWCKKEKIKKIICCGDLTNSETLETLTKNFNNEIFLIKGNIELYSEEEVGRYKNINYLGRQGIIKIENKKIGICHEPYFIDGLLEKNNLDYIFYGHTHKPWTEKKDGVQIFNPGTLGGVFQKATFAIWDADRDAIELKLLENL